MTRVPAHSLSQKSADAQIDAAILRLVDLLARQAAGDLVADAPTAEETANARPDLQDT